MKRRWAAFLTKDSKLIPSHTKALISTFQLIKATADVMELSRTQVGFAVELKQCDSIFAVYNILLQEELKQRYNRDSKTASSLVIRDHDNTTQLTGGSAEKRRRMNENESKWSRNILQKNRLRNTQAKRHSAMKTRTLNSEWWVMVDATLTFEPGIITILFVASAATDPT